MAKKRPGVRYNSTVPYNQVTKFYYSTLVTDMGTQIKLVYIDIQVS